MVGDHKEAAAARRVTINDVSDALGLTKSTVSRALNHYPDIAERTRLRVQRMADKMGYRPMSQAQAIRTGLSKSLGLVIQMADHDAQRPFLAEFLAGLSKGTSVEGWTLTLGSSASAEATIEVFREMIRDRKVDGFILPRTMYDDPRVALLREMGMPFVMFGRTSDPTGCAWYDVLGEDAMASAVQRLAEFGHTRIAFINGGMRYTYAQLRRDGFQAAMEEAGLAVDPALMHENCVTRADGAAAAHRLMLADAPPTAIVCAVDMAALGVYRAAEELGLSIGSDLSVVAYDGTPDGAHTVPPLSTYAVDYTAAGERLSALLIQRIKGVPLEVLRETVRPTFLDRGSIGPPSLSSAQLSESVALHRRNPKASMGGRP